MVDYNFVKQYDTDGDPESGYTGWRGTVYSLLMIGLVVAPFVWLHYDDKKRWEINNSNLEKIFQNFDLNDDGVLSRREFQKYLGIYSIKKDN